MDVQPVIDPYACIMYIVSYVTNDKRENGEIGEVLRAAMKQHADKDIRSQMRKIGSVFLTHREVSAQEAVFHLLGLSVLTTTASTPVNDPLGPAYCTRARTCRRELTEGKMYCEEIEPGMSRRIQHPQKKPLRRHR